MSLIRFLNGLSPLLMLLLWVPGFESAQAAVVSGTVRSFAPGELTLTHGQTLRLNSQMTLQLTPTGNLRYSVGSDVKWETRTQGSASHRYAARFQSDGALVINNVTTGLALYQSGTSGVGHRLTFASRAPYLIITEAQGSVVMTGTQNFVELRLRSGRFLNVGHGNSGIRMYMQASGVLSVYTPHGVWSNGTARAELCAPTCSAHFDAYQNLRVVNDRTNAVVWNSQTPTSHYFSVRDDQTILQFHFPSQQRLPSANRMTTSERGSFYSIKDRRIVRTDFSGDKEADVTLLTEARPLEDVIVHANRKHLYYTMDGSLYCFALSLEHENGNCRFRAADATHVRVRAGGGQLSWKYANLLQIADGPNVVTYPIPKPREVTKNLLWGVNGHPGKGLYTDLEREFRIMNRYNIRTYRLGGSPLRVNFAETVRGWVSLAQRYNIRPSFMIDLAWAVTRDGRTFETTPNEIYQASYRATYDLVLPFRDSIQDWELGNELDLKQGNKEGVGLYGRGWRAAEWDTDYWRNWAHTVRGASDAIRDINSRYRTNLRRLVNVTSTHFGFVDMLLANGVEFDVLTYHAYKSRGISLYSLPGGAGGLDWNVFSHLAKYRKPVHLNEINCGEISASTYTNEPGSALMQRCHQTLRTQINYWRNNTQIDLEQISFYQLLDEPWKEGKESRFGLMWDYDRPKPSLFLLGAFAGAKLTAEERQILTRENLLPLQ